MPARAAAPPRKFTDKLIEQPVHQIDRIVFLLIDYFGVHLCHLHVRMAEAAGINPTVTAIYP